MATYPVHLSPRTWGTDEPWWDFEVAATCRKGEWAGRYQVILTATGQHIGYVTRTSDGTWAAGIANSAYYPADTDILESTALHHSHRADSWAKLETSEGWPTRTDAVQDILWQLCRRDAASTQSLVDAVRADWVAAHEAAQAVRHCSNADCGNALRPDEGIEDGICDYCSDREDLEDATDPDALFCSHSGCTNALDEDDELDQDGEGWCADCTESARDAYYERQAEARKERRGW